MDLRTKKTLRSIKNAFIELRARKPLERITVKELAELAEVSKATFYLHYHDIYDLSDHMQKEVIRSILENISQPDLLLTNEIEYRKELFQAFYSEQSLIDILFADSQSAVLPMSIEMELKEYICRLVPHAKDNDKFNILLTYKIY